MILLFTDGYPTEKVNGEDPIASSYTAASKAGEKGVPIFAVGFLHAGPDDKARQILEGIVSRGGAGGKAFIVQDVEGLHEVFRVLARTLVTLE